MTTSYLFVYYTLDSQFSISSSMSVETGLFFPDFLLYHYSNLSYYKLLLCYGKLKKQKQKKKQKREVEKWKNEKCLYVKSVLLLF